MVAKRFLAMPGSIADLERLWSKAKWLLTSHGPTLRTSQFFKTALRVGSNADGLAMLPATGRTRGRPAGGRRSDAEGAGAESDPEGDAEAVDDAWLEDP